jgi:hypothetical protein
MQNLLCLTISTGVQFRTRAKFATTQNKSRLDFHRNGFILSYKTKNVYNLLRNAWCFSRFYRFNAHFQFLDTCFLTDNIP